MTIKKEDKDKNVEVVDIKKGYRHVLSEETELDGDMYKEINLDFSKLKGRQLSEAQRDYNRFAGANVSGDGSSIMKDALFPQADQTYQAFVAAKAAGVHVNVIFDLSAQDFIAVTRATAIFLLSTGL